MASTINDDVNDDLIPPVSSVDYVQSQGWEAENSPVAETIPDLKINHENDVDNGAKNDVDKEAFTDIEVIDTQGVLMTTMSFSDWLIYFTRKPKLKIESGKENLIITATTYPAEMPENISPAEDSATEVVITPDYDIASETLADLYFQQGKYKAAVEMYKKLSLLYPEKSAYFAQKIQILNKLV